MILTLLIIIVLVALVSFAGGVELGKALAEGKDYPNHDDDLDLYL